jgi:seryl-tRNA synthetase
MLPVSACTIGANRIPLGADMTDIYIENYKKSVAKILDRWGKEMDKLGKQLAPIAEELSKLEALKSPDAETKKKIDALKKQEDGIQKEIDNASASLRVNMMLIEVPPQANDKELVKLPDWLKEIIKQKGLPLGKGVSIAPDVSFDFKKKKLKSIGITVHFP